ncbi:MAG TPA: hypothetical protein VJU61_22540 [Polyangiaceae bacterium]|nr:hypothetical protein [Polyangiaceae bacterium]
MWAFSSVLASPAGELARPLAALSTEDAPVSALDTSAALLCERDALESSDSEAGAGRECGARAPAAPTELGTASASALELGKGAPMCDLTGASVEVRVEIPEVDQGRLDVLPCEVVAALFGWKLDDRQLEEGAALFGDPQPAPPPIAPQERAAAALAPPLSVLVRAEPQHLPVLPHEGLLGSRGYRLRLYRPPLVRS